MKRYLPLLVFVFIALIASLSISYGELQETMFLFMGLLFCNFSMLKLFNLSGFVEGFQKYDGIAHRFPIYGYLYPFIELGLGVSYLSTIGLAFALPFTVLLLAISAVSVARSLRQGIDVRCACMGTALDVPLSTVTLVEDVGMGLMALYLLFN